MCGRLVNKGTGVEKVEREGDKKCTGKVSLKVGTTSESPGLI